MVLGGVFIKGRIDRLKEELEKYGGNEHLSGFALQILKLCSNCKHCDEVSQYCLKNYVCGTTVSIFKSKDPDTFLENYKYWGK